MKKVVPLILPDLARAGTPMRVSLWHAAVGEPLRAGDRLLEIVADSVLVDVPAPATGMLWRRLVAEEETVIPGQTLGLLHVPADD